ncbi:hypothetical protein Nepgr_023473 [Nepenthes gracilis]|uniref:Uncharacterized protein n=1 Tax=Nepenthes gracilis TaxID=150966 RepID=A0AAD3XZG3_NEPGR|nr:hypothetical protein Nepgr_023473 [Nepenthes gracilis]
MESSEEAVFVIVAQERHLDLEEQFYKYVTDYAFAGPRTLILTYLELNQTEYTEFTQNSAKTRNSLSVDRAPTIDQVAKEMEDDLILLGATSPARTHLNGVPRCLANLTLMRASLKEDLRRIMLVFGRSGGFAYADEQGLQLHPWLKKRIILALEDFKKSNS